MSQTPQKATVYPTQVQENPLLGGVRGGLVMAILSHPPRPTGTPPRRGFMNRFMAKTFTEGKLSDLCVHGSP